jgi:hypothetical protein
MAGGVRDPTFNYHVWSVDKLAWLLGVGPAFALPRPAPQRRLAGFLRFDGYEVDGVGILEGERTVFFLMRPHGCKLIGSAKSLSSVLDTGAPVIYRTSPPLANALPRRPISAMLLSLAPNAQVG